MTYKLWLDDIRDPEEFIPAYLPDLGDEWVWCKDYNEAVAFVKKYGFPSQISFDHDLGLGKTGHDFAIWLCYYDLDFGGMPDDFRYYVHSANPVGAQNIYGYLRSYFEFKEICKREIVCNKVQK